MFIFPLSKLRGRNFLLGGWNVTPRSRNTYLVAYSDFSIVFFDLLPVFIIYMIVLSWIRIHELVVSPSLNREPDPSEILDLVFLVFRFDRC